MVLKIYLTKLRGLLGNMRQVHVNEIVERVKALSVEINTGLGEDIVDALKKAAEMEESSIGKEVLGHLLENIKIAREESLPICQDTGLAVIFVEMGQDVHIIGGNLREAINEGVRQGYREGYLRKSVLNDPLLRKNREEEAKTLVP